LALALRTTGDPGLPAAHAHFRQTSVGVDGHASIAEEAVLAIKGLSAEIVSEDPEMRGVLPHCVDEQVCRSAAAAVRGSHIEALEFQRRATTGPALSPTDDTHEAPLDFGEGDATVAADQAIAPTPLAVAYSYLVKIFLWHQAGVRLIPAGRLEGGDRVDVVQHWPADGSN
jgi:hypothetical protein